MRTVWGAAILGLSVGLASGFVLANFSHRSQDHQNQVSAQIQSLPLEKAENSTVPIQKNARSESLSPEELQRVIARADGEESNGQLQRDLGLALFRYALLEENSELLFDAIRLLERAERNPSLRSKEIYQTLGDSLFILAQQRDVRMLFRARSAYQKALEIEPDNPDLLVSLGLTFFSQKPPELSAAIKQFRQALIIDPKHEKCLESLIVALADAQKGAEAAAAIEKLERVNPGNKRLSDLKLIVEQKQLTSVK